MSFEVKVDAVDFLNSLAQIEQQVFDLQTELPREFEAWQREDMNRKYPHYQLGTLSVTTSVWPRSRRPSARRNAGPKGRKVRKAVSRPGIKRPILRPVLVDMLMARMVAMCAKALKREKL
jgi:hypothetical protein